MFCVCDIDTAQYNWMNWIRSQHKAISASFIYGKFRDNHNFLLMKRAIRTLAPFIHWNDPILFFRLHSQLRRIIRLDETEAKISKHIKYTKIMVHSIANGSILIWIQLMPMKWTVVIWNLRCWPFTLVFHHSFHSIVRLLVWSAFISFAIWKETWLEKNIDLIKKNVNNNNCVTHYSYA